jgi:alanyl-tRNA synthetase
MGGKGGGRPDFAQGAAHDLSGFSNAENKLSSLVGAGS